MCFNHLSKSQNILRSRRCLLYDYQKSEGIKKGPGVGDQVSEVRRLRKARIKLIALRKGVEIVEAVESVQLAI